MSTLALDLGTLAGWALDPPGKLYGLWNLKPNRFDGGGMRFVRFRNNLDALMRAHRFTKVVFEEVRAHKAVDAAHVYGGLLATLQTWCEDAYIPYEGIPVGEIKKFFAGKGNANKSEMLAAGWKKGFADVTDDNVMDAIAIWHCVQNRGQ